MNNEIRRATREEARALDERVNKPKGPLSDQMMSAGDVEVRLYNPVQILVNGAAQTFGAGTWFVTEACAKALVAGDPNRRARILSAPEIAE